MSSLHDQIRARQAAEDEIRRMNEELEERIEQRTAELKEINHELQAFTYSVSHDLRAPLRHMDGFSRILQQECGPKLPEEANHYLNRVRNAATHMSELVEDLLDFSRIGRQAPQKKPVQLAIVAEEARTEAQAEAGERKIEWKIGVLPEVEGDALLLHQVLINLVSNAVKFTG
jgi:light-regulated signal transduction histidine kinase (bacteriophytochrome)